ncbi:hypothetical protein ABZ214_34190 [Streptomyces iakyrus]|uniref:hypothetical protein n=1 Tax=Streptomyces iakyrus TaxID=68219 RepID=UPI0033B96C86
MLRLTADGTPTREIASGCACPPPRSATICRRSPGRRAAAAGSTRSGSPRSRAGCEPRTPRPRPVPPRAPPSRALTAERPGRSSRCTCPAPAGPRALSRDPSRASQSGRPVDQHLLSRVRRESVIPGP